MNKKIIFTIGLCLILAQNFYCQIPSQSRFHQKEIDQIENIEKYFDLSKIEKFGWHINYETEGIDSIGVNWSEQWNVKKVYSYGSPLKLDYKNAFTINLTRVNTENNIWRKIITITKNNKSETSFKIRSYALEFDNSDFKCQPLESFRKGEKIKSSRTEILIDFMSGNSLEFSTRLGFDTRKYNQNKLYKCFVANSDIIVTLNHNTYIKPFDFSYYANHDNKYFFDSIMLKRFSEFFDNQPFDFFKDLSALKTKHLEIDIPFKNTSLKSRRGQIIFNNNLVLGQFYIYFEKKIKENTYAFKLENDEIVEIKLKKLKKHLKKLGLKNIAVNFEQLHESATPRIRVEFLLEK
ncbi:hypothetical protein [Aureivirga sp. CE67]|uniref:hypothetical protein n=1 Tax=Aureivirga sp. CE67 TaxID=1788983 RepID=UPI0018CADB85|nr:hypothetical protein [Aureivirga sp. CE67]